MKNLLNQMNQFFTVHKRQTLIKILVQSTTIHPYVRTFGKMDIVLGGIHAYMRILEEKLSLLKIWKKNGKNNKKSKE